MSPTDEEALQTAKAFMGYIYENPDPDHNFHGHELWPSSSAVALSLLPSVSVTIRLRIPQSFANRVQNLHGGATAMIFDNLNSVALTVWATHSAPTSDLAHRWQTTGVSRTLNVSYLRPVKVGEEVDVVNEVVSVGKKLALVRGTMIRVSDGKLVATSEHHKVSPEMEKL